MRRGFPGITHRSAFGFSVITLLIAGPAFWAIEPVGPRSSWVLAANDLVVALVPDGSALIVQGKDGLEIRGAASGRLRARLAPYAMTHNRPVFSPDGRLYYAEVPSKAFDPVPTLDLEAWEVGSGRLKAVYPYVADGLGYSGGDFTLSADGSRLAVLDNSARLPMKVRLDSLEGMEINGIKLHGTTGSNENRAPSQVRVWGVGSRKDFGLFSGGPWLALSPDGRWLATSDAPAPSGEPDSETSGLTVWEVETRRPRFHLDLSGKIAPSGLGFSPDGNRLGYRVDSACRVVDIPTRATLLGSEVTPWGPPSTFSRDGRFFFPEGLSRSSSLDQSHPTPGCWDLSTTPPRRIGVVEGAYSTSTDGRLCAVATWSDGGKAPGPIRLMDLGTGAEILRVDQVSITDAKISPDGRSLALIRAESRQPSRAQGVPDWLRPVASFLHLDDPGNHAYCVELIDVRSGEIRAKIERPEVEEVRFSTGFSADSRTLAVFHHSGVSHDPSPTAPNPAETVEFWDVPPRRPPWPIARRTLLATALGAAGGTLLDVRRRRRSVLRAIEPGSEDRPGTRIVPTGDDPV